MLTDEVCEKARALGASLAGVADSSMVLSQPVYRQARPPRALADTRSLVIVALAHPADRPELDWWDNQKGGTAGNRRLMRINRELALWLKNEHGIKARGLPYPIDRGGIFLKDAAVCAGLGVIGKNNLLITDAYGPRVRLRALALDKELRAGDRLEVDPCRDCPAPCLTACPQRAFDRGRYHRPTCKIQMAADEAGKRLTPNPVAGLPGIAKILYCRRCELVCPVGQ